MANDCDQCRNEIPKYQVAECRVYIFFYTSGCLVWDQVQDFVLASHPDRVLWLVAQVVAQSEMAVQAVAQAEREAQVETAV
jgi:hypothetical protein